MNFDVSVIVPVYGVEKYIKVCIDSILNQTLKSLEVIIVNDCSPDNSMKICTELYGNNERVQLINQPKNMGAGEARNTGLLRARGKYIGFIDGDDQVYPDMFEKMFNAAKEYDADVVHNTGIVGSVPAKKGDMPVDMLDPEKNLTFRIWQDVGAPNKITLLDDDLDKRLRNWLNHHYHWTIWNNIYKKEFLDEHNIHFLKMKLAEDLAFFVQTLFSAKKYVLLPGQWYLYRPSATSLSRTGDNIAKTLKALESEVIGTESIKAELSKIPFFRDNRNNMSSIIDHMLRGLEDGFIRQVFQVADEDTLRKSEALHEFFVSEFGNKAEYIEFLFYELHKNYPHFNDEYEVSRNEAIWETIRQNYPKYKETGNVSDLWEGFK